MRCFDVLLGTGLCLMACNGTASKPLVDTETTDLFGHRFGFAIVADPHIAGPADHEARLQNAVSWINEHAERRVIELVFVLGDIGWGEGLPTSFSLLSELSPMWIPIIGDNVVISEQDAEFASTFAPQYELLSQSLDQWEHSDSPVWDPNYGLDSHLQNFRFEYNGVQFIGLDWNIRGIGGLAAEFADLHDFRGGSWPFLLESLDGVEQRKSESVVLLSHIPLMAGALDVDEVGIVNGALSPIGQWIDSAYAGHMHVTYDLMNKPGGYEVRVTDATWDDDNFIRVVDVHEEEGQMIYEQELIRID